MADPANGSSRFDIQCSGAIASAIRRVHRQAHHEGRGERVTSAFREIIRRLRRDAFEAGEPAYRLPGLRMQVRTIIIQPLVVDFAVCEDRPLVFIKGVKLLSAQGGS